MRPKSTCKPNDIYCKCEGCQYIMGMSWALPEGVSKLMSLIPGNSPPPIPNKCDFCPEPCGNKWCPTNESK